ncbi:MAG TPA: M48 family metalloprotease [Blastocatellia bacterium]|nr:M48 family metalloprotease [Blastocatellia bacterium]
MYRLFVFVLVIICLAAASAPAQSPCKPPALAPPPPGSNMFTDELEVALGDAMAEQTEKNYGIIEDEALTAYLNQIGQRIIRHLPPNNLRFRFAVVDLPEPNAFVLPGGRVYVTRKLIALARNEDEVAGVIGHEIGHVLAHHSALQMTRIFRELLGVSELKDRRDVFDKYNRYVENIARLPKNLRQSVSEDKNQMMADQIGLYAAAAAGYDPQGNANLFDRITENKGNTGSFFSDLFGTTKPEAKRLREMLKDAASIPPACIEARAATAAEDFRRWQSVVVNYTVAGRKEALHSVIKKIALEPPLRGDINRLRFSPDGRYLLAQDDSGINVLTREPFAALFRIEAPEAQPAQFSPDSQEIIFATSGQRVESWSVADKKLKWAHEMFIRKGCLQSLVSPDGKSMACLDTDLNLNLYDVQSGQLIVQKKSFYTPDLLAVLTRLLGAFVREDADLSDLETQHEWINMHYSPDGRYFAAGARSMTFNAIGSMIADNSSFAYDLTARQAVSLGGSLKKMMGGGFDFIGPDRVFAVDRENFKNSAVLAFPAGTVIDRVPLLADHLEAPTRGNYLLIRPMKDYAVAAVDLAKKTIFKAYKKEAFDFYDQEFVAEQLNGEIGLFGVEKNDLHAKLVLPRNPLGRLRTAALSPDWEWLAVSERSRGAVWNLATGERVFHVRGFRGSHFGEDTALYADFPRYEQTERNIARLDLRKRDATTGPGIKEARVMQYGPLAVAVKPDKDGSYQENVTIEVSNVLNGIILWSRPFAKEAPRFWADTIGQTVTLGWPVTSEAAKAILKSDAALSQRLAAIKEKEGVYLLAVLDARSGKERGRLLVETGKGSFRISSVQASGDWVVISDNQNRVLVYQLASGEARGKVFGGRAALSQESKLLAVENEAGKLTLYDLASMEKRDQFVFSSPVSLARFSADGRRLFALTANQAAYVIDVSAPPR